MKKSNIIIGILIVFVLIIGIKYFNIKSENEWLQSNIDEIFITNYSSLNADMMTIALNPDMTEEELAFYTEKTTKEGNIVSSLMSSTSYRNNIKLNNIVRLLDQASGSDSFLTITMTEEINANLTQIMVDRFENQELIEETYELIKNSSKKR